MIFEKVKAGKSIEAIGHWDRLDIEGTLEPGETIEQAYAQAKEKLDKLLPGIDSVRVDPVEEKVKDPIAGHIGAINSASNLAALNWHRALVEKEGDKHPELREAFDKKLQELNNK